jgi:protein-S-isoprenylcysteine O-methyltransferase Ste14
MTQTIAAIVWFAGLVGWYIIRQPFERRAKRIPVSQSFYDKREASLLMAALFGLFFVPAVYVLTGIPAMLDYTFVPVVAWLGAIALATSLWLFRRSHADLGRNWSISLEIRERHALVKTGVYRRIRHPMYTSFFLLSIAQALLLPNWFVGAAGLAGAAVLFGFRVRREEQLMLDRFGDEYRAYMSSSKRLVPWLV